MASSVRVCHTVPGPTVHSPVPSVLQTSIFFDSTSKEDSLSSLVKVSAKLSTGNYYNLELDLAYHIVPKECLYKVLSSKIEIKLRKQDGFRWTILESNAMNHDVEQIDQETSQIVNQPYRYPSSCKKSKDWDKVQKEIEKREAEEKQNNETDLNELFQQIYGKGTDEVRRAMNKSFQESSGTVLSTRWSEVGKGKVNIMPPDGVEWKSWAS